MLSIVTNGTRGFFSSQLHPDETASVFASDITRRISKTPGTIAPEAAGGVADSATDIEASKKSEQLDKLESALSNTVAWMREEHGEQAATALMGIVYKRLGDGEVTENALGDAFLDVTRFIDSNFGTDAGDKFLDHLNGSLNDSLNAYFENGLNEQFMAVTSPAGLAGMSATAGAAPGAASDLTSQVKDAVQQILDDIKKFRPQAGKPINPYITQQDNSMLGILKDIMA